MQVNALLTKENVIFINEKTSNVCRFNVMPGKFVEETLFIKQYRIYDNFIEADFERQYHSDMVKSPDHFVFLTALSHTQKMVYVYLCYKFGITYDPFTPEKIKIWATKVEVDLPKLITNTNVTQKLEVISLTKVKEKQYITEVLNSVTERMRIRAICNIYLID
jgi:hypothetical protein